VHRKKTLSCSPETPLCGWRRSEAYLLPVIKAMLEGFGTVAVSDPPVDHRPILAAAAHSL
jgi:hypothetical protein